MHSPTLTSLLLLQTYLLPLTHASTTPLPSILQIANPAQKCTQLAKRIESANKNVHVNFQHVVPAGTSLSFSQAGTLAECGQGNQVVGKEICRVAMRVKTGGKGEITLEAWLPTSWNGRFLGTGNGGISGCIGYGDLAYATDLGFATVGANNGHNGTRGFAFSNNPDAVEDFAYRSMHTGVVVGKQLSSLFYGRKHKKSYYIGCSTGGRQGWKAVQSFPEDFDGVVVGAPAMNFNGLQSSSASYYPIFGDKGDPTYFAGEDWDLVNAEVLKQCDAIDGVTDGVLEDPALCPFRPEALLCSSKKTSSSQKPCLSGAKVAALKEAYTDLYGVDGKLIFSRMRPGGELEAKIGLFSGSFPYSTDWFQYLIYNDTTWDPAKFTILDAKAAIDQNPFNIATWEGDLSKFQKRGSKVIHYHGHMDRFMSSANSVRYYNHVAQTMGKTSDELDDFYRFFRISGMAHCGGGAGASNIGQSSYQVSKLDPENNILLKIVDWVEKESAPEKIRGTKFVNDDKAQGVDLVRDHCKYPKRNFCIDPKNYKSPQAWKCI